MSLRLLNSAPRNTAASQLRQCCSSEEWVARMLQQRPFRDSDALHAAADSAWIGLGEQDYLEAFSGHPKIGDIQSLQKNILIPPTLPDQNNLESNPHLTIYSKSSRQLIMLTKRNLDLFLSSALQEKARLKCWQYFKIASRGTGQQS